MKTLLIGSDGTLGTSLLCHAGAVHGVQPWTQKDCDLTDLEGIATKLADVRPDVIINASAYTDVDGAESHERLATTINGDAVERIAEYCGKQGALLVHFSTDYVFSGSEPTGYTEDAAPSPINAYGRSKRAGEIAVQQSGCEYLLIRTSRLFGRPSKSTAKKSFIDKMLELATAADTLSVVDDERTSPTFADDLAQATYDLLNDNVRGLYHRTNDGDCTWFAFAREIFSIKNVTVSLQPVPGSTFRRAARRPACSTLRSTKLPPLRPWQESLRYHLSHQ